MNCGNTNLNEQGIVASALSYPWLSITMNHFNTNNIFSITIFLTRVQQYAQNNDYRHHDKQAATG